MPGATPRAVRLVDLLRRLERGDLIVASDLANEHGCSQRTVERDLRALARRPFGLRIEREGWSWYLEKRTHTG
jgi:predicted DNA-binding transcriptional regulator YafY